MILLIDLGNSQLKWWLHEAAGHAPGGSSAVEAGRPAPIASGEVRDWSNWQGPEGVSRLTGIGLCSVADPQASQALMGRLSAGSGSAACHVFAAGCQVQGLTLASHYRLDQLGADRWAAALGALAVSTAQPSRAPQRLALVSAGTASVVDFLELGGVGPPTFLGGYLLPGWQLMRSGLLDNTAQISHAMTVCTHIDFDGLPNQTEQALHWGIAAAQMGPLLLQAPPDRLLVHGGARERFVAAYDALLAPRWGLAAEAMPDLIARGLLAWSESW